MTYNRMYRNTLGEALQKALDDLVHEQMIPLQLAVNVLAIYVKAINKALAQKAKNKALYIAPNGAVRAKILNFPSLQYRRKKIQPPNDARIFTGRVSVNPHSFFGSSLTITKSERLKLNVSVAKSRVKIASSPSGAR
ncbi:unnamed protein product [Nippostrongylus brasiliensis]|uniref:Transcription initiation factor IIA subunit 2 (inferred by orthology to a C. elegans protein) n=1 Tax=Nippostrongylus brasiliensis TaxID=27835 RepID=A0A0N4XVR8_NIPBR|nr:unnamed protein product [Nippostrongylus brasiliensis]